VRITRLLETFGAASQPVGLDRRHLLIFFGTLALRLSEHLKGDLAMPSTPSSALRRLAQSAVLSSSLLATGLAAASPAGKDFAACMNAPLVHFPGNIVQAAMATPSLSTLVQLVAAANLVGPLSAPGELTVFAPTNESFGKIPPAVLGAIGGNPALLSAVLTYHVSPRTVDPRRPYLREVPTLQGQSLFVEHEWRSGPQVNQSKVDCTGVRTSNGTVWIIDSVLLPQFR
jgi:uncharacterized surface protein with fasciclin (FAS1) repeats